MFDGVFNEVEARLDPHSGDLTDIAAWASKHRSRVARIAAILHLLRRGPDGLHSPIDAETAKAAAEIGAYLIAHAQAVLPMVGAAPAPHLDRARSILRWIRSHKLAVFSTRELQQAGVGGRHRAGEAEGALELLVERGYLRVVEVARPGGAGRHPSARYEVNPATFGTTA